jgi:predicted Fe-S protein YdhL (DUF1289 family)
MAAASLPSGMDEDISTPCVSICQIDENLEICVGCGRTRREIAAWRSLSEMERRRIMESLPTRMNIGARRS